MTHDGEMWSDTLTLLPTMWIWKQCISFETGKVGWLSLTPGSHRLVPPSHHPCTSVLKTGGPKKIWVVPTETVAERCSPGVCLCVSSAVRDASRLSTVHFSNWFAMVDLMASHPTSASGQHWEAFTLAEECWLISYRMPHKRSENGPDLRSGVSGSLRRTWVFVEPSRECWLL